MNRPVRNGENRSVETFKEILINNLGKDELLRRLKDKGTQFNKYADQLFEDPAFAPSGTVEKVKLVRVNLSDLGLTKPAIYQEIVAKAEDLGLKLCPLILAAYLRLEYSEQSEGPYLKVASPKVGNSDDYPRGLYLRNINKVLWLRGFRASDDWEYPLDMEFVFRQ